MSRLKTVKDLKLFLQDLPDDARVELSGEYCASGVGGFDAWHNPFVPEYQGDLPTGKTYPLVYLSIPEFGD